MNAQADAQEVSLASDDVDQLPATKSVACRRHSTGHPTKYRGKVKEAAAPTARKEAASAPEATGPSVSSWVNEWCGCNAADSRERPAPHPSVQMNQADVRCGIRIAVAAGYGLFPRSA